MARGRKRMGGRAKVVPNGGPSPEKFADAESRGIKIKDCKAVAGYAPSTDAQMIRKSKRYRTAIMTIEQDRERARAIKGASLTDIAGRMVDISTKKCKIDGKLEHREVARDRIAADRMLVSVLGYESPKQVQVASKGLMMEFKDLTSDDLQLLIDNSTLLDDDNTPGDIPRVSPPQA